MWGANVHYTKTRGWALGYFGDDLATAVGKWDAETDKRYPGATKHPAFHGHDGAEAKRDELVSQAKQAWKRGKRIGEHGAAFYLGEALHTQQDVFAHRRTWLGYTHEDGITSPKWSENFGKWKAENKHTSHHDDWSQAYESCRDHVVRKTKSVLSSFKSWVRREG